MNLNSFYTVKPYIPRWLQIRLRQYLIAHRLRRDGAAWPISELAGAAPPGFPGWPDGKRFAVVLTHDVEFAGGTSRCEAVADFEEARGFRSSFGFVPLRYHTPERLRRMLTTRGFEVMVHDLYHDGKLYRSRRIFEDRRSRINGFLREWQARGFCSGSMHHNLAWIGELDVDYDISTYDVDPFEPQACGTRRIFPFWVQSPNSGSGYVELPYTLPQDFTAFVLLGERTNVIWRKKLDWIAGKGGLVLLKTHPDYIRFPNERKRIDGYPVELYTSLLDYIRQRYGDEAWFALPSEMARYWRGLRLGNIEGSTAIPWHETFCASCRRAHADGWLHESPSHAPFAFDMESRSRPEAKLLSALDDPNPA